MAHFPVDTSQAGDGFSQYAEAVHEQPGTDTVFDHVLAALQSGAVVREDGAGLGIRTAQMARHGCRVLACEPVASMRERMVTCLKDAGISVREFDRDEQWSLGEEPGSVTVLPYGVSEDIGLSRAGAPLSLRIARHLLYHVARREWIGIIKGRRWRHPSRLGCAVLADAKEPRHHRQPNVGAFRIGAVFFGYSCSRSTSRCYGVQLRAPNHAGSSAAGESDTGCCDCRVDDLGCKLSRAAVNRQQLA